MNAMHKIMPITGSRDQRATASFLLLTQYLVQYADEQLQHRAFHLKAHLWQSFDQDALPADARQALGQCLLKKGRHWPALTLPEATLKGLLQMFYNLCCEQFGPVETDALFARLMDRVEQTPTGQGYSCRRLL